MRPDLRSIIRLEKGCYEVRSLLEKDVDEQYVAWLNDPETTKFMAVKPGSITINSQREYVRNITESSDNAVFGIFDKDGGLLGTSGLQKLNSPDGISWMGVLIGSKKHRGMGMGRILIWTVASMVFSEFNVKSIRADMYVENVGSYKAFLGAGFVDIGSNNDKRNVKVVECTKNGTKDIKYMGIIERQLFQLSKGGLL